MITQTQFKTLWSGFWKAFPNVKPESAERLGPIYFEEFKDFEFATIKEVFDYLRKNFQPTFNEPLPSIATVSKRIFEMFNELERRERVVNAGDDYFIVPPKAHFDMLLGYGWKKGPYAGKSDLEISQRADLLYDNYVREIESIKNQEVA